MSSASYLFVSDLDEANNTEGAPSVKEDNLKTFYKVMNTGIECLYPVIKANDNIRLERIAMNEDYTSFTFSFPSKYIDALCGVDMSTESDLIGNWMEMEDCPYNNEKDLSDLLNALVELAKTANSTGLGMYFRMEM